MRIVSLVPSATETLALLGVADRLVGVTTYCVHGAPSGAALVGGTKNPDLERIVALAPDLVVGNTEENRPPDLAALRQRGLRVREDYPRTVRDVPELIRGLGRDGGAEPARAGAMAQAVVSALEDAVRSRPPEPVPALVLIWRKPWMGVGPGTYVDDLLRTCGFANVLERRDERYPRLDTPPETAPQVVLLPSEPYAFGPKDLEAVRALVGDGPRLEFVDGEDLTWHGPRTGDALRALVALARAHAS